MIALIKVLLAAVCFGKPKLSVVEFVIFADSDGRSVDPEPEELA